MTNIKEDYLTSEEKEYIKENINKKIFKEKSFENILERWYNHTPTKKEYDSLKGVKVLVLNEFIYGVNRYKLKEEREKQEEKNKDYYSFDSHLSKETINKILDTGAYVMVSTFYKEDEEKPAYCVLTDKNTVVNDNELGSRDYNGIVIYHVEGNQYYVKGTTINCWKDDNDHSVYESRISINTGMYYNYKNEEDVKDFIDKISKYSGPFNEYDKEEFAISLNRWNFLVKEEYLPSLVKELVDHYEKKELLFDKTDNLITEEETFSRSSR